MTLVGPVVEQAVATIVSVAAVGGAGAAFAAWRTTARNHRLLTGEDAVEGDDGVVGQLDEHGQRLQELERELARANDRVDEFDRRGRGRGDPQDRPGDD